MFVMGHSSFTQVCPHHISSWSGIVYKCSRFSFRQLPHLCPRWCWQRLKGCTDGSEGSRSTGGWPCHLITWLRIQWGASGISLGPPASFALMRCGGTSQSLSGKSTNRAALPINCPSAVIALFSPPSSSLSCWQQPMPRTTETNCTVLPARPAAGIAGNACCLCPFAGSTQGWGFCSSVVQSRVCGALLQWHFLCAGCLCRGCPWEQLEHGRHLCTELWHLPKTAAL